MKKKAYIGPAFEVMAIENDAELLAGSIQSITTSGLGGGDELIGGGDSGLPGTGNLWDLAW